MTELGDALALYHTEKVQVRLSNKKGDVAIGYVHNFDIGNSFYSHIELSDSPDKSQNASLVYISGISNIEPVDREKARQSFLEKHSQEETERILGKMCKSS